ncbi:MAG: fluoride efflux transporter CrcB [Gammaproteobacteria bacterium]|nr:fluoride efflux transporter CrcB [Gammaproteobacteria bacterium]
MSIYIAIALGGSAGAISRYWVTSTTYQWFGHHFSYGTMLVNVVGSLLMGFLAVVLVERFQVSEEVRLGIMVGFLGSFTTFSTFAMDTIQWFENGAIMKALAYIIISVLCCVLGAWAGLLTAKQIFLR